LGLNVRISGTLLKLGVIVVLVYVLAIYSKAPGALQKP